MKIKVNDNLVNILNYINTADKHISYLELFQFVIDYDLYAEFYYNQQIILKLVEEKNELIKKGGVVENET